MSSIDISPKEITVRNVIEFKSVELDRFDLIVEDLGYVTIKAVGLEVKSLWCDSGILWATFKEFVSLEVKSND